MTLPINIDHQIAQAQQIENQRFESRMKVEPKSTANYQETDGKISAFQKENPQLFDASLVGIGASLITKLKNE